MNITLKLEEMTTEALRGVAYALLNDAAICGKSRGVRMQRALQTKTIVNELEARAFGGDTSELREMIDGLDVCIEKQRVKPNSYRPRGMATVETRGIRRYYSRSLGPVTIPDAGENGRTGYDD